MEWDKRTVAIICGGGPAPGINTVISTITKIFLEDDFRVLGIHNGYQGLLSDAPSLIDFDYEKANKIFNKGGSVLNMSRFKPKESDFNINFIKKNNVKLLVTIGGDDTASTANRLTKYLNSKNVEMVHIHVPKTIDNDLPLPDRNPTFGFQSAKDQGAKIGNIIEEDARTTQSWYVLSAMGRSAGHLAFGIATSCHFPMLVIPEMFNKTRPSLDKIIDLIISSIIKRKIEGMEYGVAMVSEGVFHVLDEDEIKSSGIQFTYDEHGHPELGNVSKSNIFNILLQDRLKELDLKVKSRPNDMGYELRCCRPIGFDLTLCSLLGMGVKKLYDEGYDSCIVSANSNGDIIPLFLSDLQDENGKIPPRLVDIESDFARLCIQNLFYLKEEDMVLAKKYLDEPQKYLFKTILNW